jgi:hypothetical protein
VAVRIPGKRADRHARLHTEPRQCLGEPLHPGVRLCVIVAEDVALELAGNDLGCAVVFRRVFDEAG